MEKFAGMANFVYVVFYALFDYGTQKVIRDNFLVILKEGSSITRGRMRQICGQPALQLYLPETTLN